MSAEELAVLEVLGDVAEAFAALPVGNDPREGEDFDWALRQLRRIVLSRHRE